MSHSRKHLEKRALLCPPTMNTGSLGDQAMMQALLSLLKKRGFKTDVLIPDRRVDWRFLQHFDDQVIVRMWEPDTESLLRTFGRYEQFYMLGADVVDGYYSEPLTEWLLSLVAIASASCASSTIAGFSFNKRPTPGAIASFRSLPGSTRFCLRDQDSLVRFCELTGRAAIAVADPAFLLEADPFHQGLVGHLEWISREKRVGKVIGVNLNYHSFGTARVLDRPDVIRLYVQEIMNIISAEEAVRVLLIPHDTRGENSDDRMLREVYDGLSTERRVRLVNPDLSAASVKHLVGQLDFVLTGRMHLAIACLGMGTPIACVTYQDKFDGLFKLFGLPREFALRPVAAAKRGTLSDATLAALDQALPLRNAIAARVPLVTRLAAKNLA